ncbi:hypothetical protein RND71_019582 [Anisodus tanguticus]|uniref:Uncharacterized protein n=1 Tax=Anisodus tanguticus TaxID=243964 RepID=A0AAE1RZL0_9SOLA|nr:hypothetical protein RND71_019582 [Anisodus tanguticus]
MTGVHLNVGRIIYYHIIDRACQTTRSSPFLCLITAICQKEKVLIFRRVDRNYTPTGFCDILKLEDDKNLKKKKKKKKKKASVQTVNLTTKFEEMARPATTTMPAPPSAAFSSIATGSTSSGAPSTTSAPPPQETIPDMIKDVVEEANKYLREKVDGLEKKVEASDIEDMANIRRDLAQLQTECRTFHTPIFAAVGTDMGLPDESFPMEIVESILERERLPRMR